jgi:hypothetical protein
MVVQICYVVEDTSEAQNGRELAFSDSFDGFVPERSLMSLLKA